MGVVEAYQDAVARGVKVMIVFDSGQSAGHSSSRSQKERLATLCTANVDMKVASTDGSKTMCHQKCLVVDSSLCLFGSANMTNNSRTHAHEFGVLTTHRRTVAACEDKFERLWKKGRLITSDRIEQWRQKEAAQPSRAASTGGP